VCVLTVTYDLNKSVSMLVPRGSQRKTLAAVAVWRQTLSIRRIIRATDLTLGKKIRDRRTDRQITGRTLARRIDAFR